jgi:hypothetical protein
VQQGWPSAGSPSCSEMESFRKDCGHHDRCDLLPPDIFPMGIYIYIELYIYICVYIYIYIYSSPRNKPWRLKGLWDVKNSTLSRQSAQMAVRLSALRTSRDLLLRNINFLLLELISVTGWAHPRPLYGMKDYVNWTFVQYKRAPNTKRLAGIIEPYPLRYRALQYLC